MLQHFEIIGTGCHIPAIRITAAELDVRLNLPAGWTLRHTGVATRHRHAEGETATSMGVSAALAALKAAGKTLADVDLLIDASTCQQQPIPTNAALLQEALGPGLRGTAAFDVHASCLSFVVALSTVNAFFAAGQYRCALIVSSETPLDGLNWADPASACLMGEAAAAAVLVPLATPRPAFAYHYETYGDLAHVCEVAGGGHRLSPFELKADNEVKFRFAMDGPQLHKAASKLLPPLLQRTLSAAGETLTNLHVVPHQASGPALALLARRLGIAPGQLHSTLADHGNLVAAGIPFALHHARMKIPTGSRVLAIGTAAGYSQAAMIFTL